MDKNNSIRILRINLVLILAVWAKIHEKWLEIGNFDDSIRIFILKWGTFFILMRRYPLYWTRINSSKIQCFSDQSCDSVDVWRAGC